jgi:hypothetical protein
MWDIFIMVILIAITLVVPWRLAFVDIETLTVNCIYYTIDFIFLVDIILNFLTSYLDEK